MVQEKAVHDTTIFVVDDDDGMRRALGDDLVLLLTHDAILSRAELTALITTADAAPRFGALGPVIQFTGAAIRG